MGLVRASLVFIAAGTALLGLGAAQADGRVVNHRRFCPTPVRTADWWTPRQKLFGVTFAIVQTTNLRCRRSRTLVERWIEKGKESLPHSRRGWRCRVRRGVFVGCGRRRSFVGFALAPRFRAALDVKTDGCAAEGLNASQA